MAGYISEFQYYGDTSLEFIEVALPEGTDPSGYRVEIYDLSGNLISSFPLGTSTGTMAGHDVYVIDATTPGFDDGGADPTGRMYPDDALALVDGSNTVEQFISYWNNTVTAVDGAANGLTSSDVGTADVGESLQSDNGGSSYYAQSTTNSGAIPACYAPGSLIATPNGSKAVEQLVAGDLVLTAGGGARAIRWVWRDIQALDDLEPDQFPVLIRCGALGKGLPSRDLIVSGQHRIVVGAFGQLETFFNAPLMVPAKALTGLAGVRFMRGKTRITWHHFLCDVHSVVFANDLASESLLLGPTILSALSRREKAELSRTVWHQGGAPCGERTALPSQTVGAARRLLRGQAERNHRIADRVDAAKGQSSVLTATCC